VKNRENIKCYIKSCSTERQKKEKKKEKEGGEAGNDSEKKEDRVGGGKLEKPGRGAIR